MATVSAIGPNASHPIAVPCAAYLRMASEWQLIHDLRGGTLEMRRVAIEYERWLMREDGEKTENFHARVNRSVLYEGYTDAVDDLMAKPFSKPIEFDGELPSELAGMFDDADLEGTSVTEYGRKWLRDAADHGASYTLVDFPPAGGQQTHGDEIASRIRPYFVMLSSANVIGWTEAKGPNGQPRMTSLRWKECENVSGEYGITEVERVRRMVFVYQDQIDAAIAAGIKPPQGFVEVWQEVEDPQTKKMTWKIVDTYTHTFVGLPIVQLPLEMLARMESRPVLRKLAWLNVQHWASASDQNNNLRFARVGILTASGLTAAEAKDEKLKIGPNSFVKLTNPDAKLAYVTGGTEGVVVGRQDLVDLEAKMQSLGVAPILERRNGSQPATGAALEDQDTTCDLQTWARLEETALLACFEIAAQWAKVKLADKFKVKIFTKFAIPFAQTQDVAALNTLEMSGNLSKRTMWKILQEWKFLPDSFDPDEEERLLAEQGAPDNSTVDEFGNPIPPPTPTPAPPVDPNAKPVPKQLQAAAA